MADFAMELLTPSGLSDKILDLNEKTFENGMTLSVPEAKELAETRLKALSDYGRIEIGLGATQKIITKFSESSFVNRENYAETLNDLVKLFYYVKDETDDGITDDALITYMYEFFENSCFGSTELLANRELAALINYVNSGKADYHLTKEDDYNAGPESDAE